MLVVAIRIQPIASRTTKSTRTAASLR
jgi:hypothetical protein